jgi:hypothetical protein
MNNLDGIWNAIIKRKAVVPAQAEIPSDRVIGGIYGSQQFQPDEHYFAVIINELFLENARQWFKEYHPVVLVITQFSYGGDHVTLPFLVGPKMLGSHADQAPQGMIYRNTRVAGIHPFRGGRVISTIVLCRQKRHDYARRLLSLVEGVAGAIPFGKEMNSYIKVADSLLDGMDALMGVGDTEALVGLRQEFDHDLGPPVRPAYFVLVDAPESRVPINQFWIKDENLFVGKDSNSLAPYRQASYVLYSMRSSKSHSELNTLPFVATKRKIIELSASTNEKDWKRAKAELLVLFRQLLSSPDLTRSQAKSYHEEIVNQAIENRNYAKNIGNLRANQPGNLPLANSKTVDKIELDLRSATSILDLD